MKQLLKIGLGLVMGGASTGVGLPVILAAAAAALTALGGLAYTAHRYMESWKEDLRTEGRQECIGKVNEQAMTDLQVQLEKKTREAEAAVKRAKALEDARQSDEDARKKTAEQTAKAHEEIDAVKTGCTVPDAMVDAVNSIVPQKFKTKTVPVRAVKVVK